MSEPTGTRRFAPFEWMLSLRYLRARRQEGFISIIAGFSFLGIMLGVATLIIVMAVMNGFRKELLGKILGLNGHLLVQPLESPLTDYQAVAERLSKLEGIRLAVPIVEGQALASSPFNAAGVLVRGIRGDDLNGLTSIAKNIKQGTLENFDDSQGVAIGRRLADQLSLHAGDTITLVSPKGAVTPMGTTPRIKPYRIAAVFEIGMSDYDGTFVFMPLTEAQNYFNRTSDVTSIEVFTTNPDRIDEFRKSVTEAAGRPVFLVGLLVCLNIESIRQFMSWLTNTELFSPELYFLSRLPADLDVGETTAVVVMALALSLLATLYPSWRAARLDPVEALRYE